MENIQKIFDFINTINRLKYELRFKKRCSNVDSVAAHSWRLAMMVYLLGRELNIGLDVDKCMKIAIVHDLAETLTGDLTWDDAFANPKLVTKKEVAEETAMKKLTAILPAHLGDEIYALSKEYRDATTPEAWFVKIMDKLECAEQVIFMGMDKVGDWEATAHHTMKGFGKFPEVDKVINFVRNRQKAEFIKHGIEWLPEWDLKNPEEKESI